MITGVLVMLVPGCESGDHGHNQVPSCRSSVSGLDLSYSDWNSTDVTFL